MSGLNWLVGIAGAVVSLAIIYGAVWLGWKLLSPTIDLLRTATRPSLWTLLYYVGVLGLIIVVVSVFIPLFFTSLAIGIRDSREAAQSISIELNSWVLQSIDNARNGGYGSFPTQEASTPYVWGESGGATETPTPFTVEVAPATPTQVWLLPTVSVIPPTATPAVLVPATPVVEPTMDLGAWNVMTPPPTPGG